MQRRIETLEGKAKPGGPRGSQASISSDRLPWTAAHAQPLGCWRSVPRTGLSGGWTQRTREVIDLPLVPVQVTEHVYVARTCPLCQTLCVPSAQLEGVVLGKQRLGVNPVSSTGQALVSLIAALREEARLPWRTIQWYLGTDDGLHLSLGALVDGRQSGRQSPGRTGNGNRGSPVVHADETGWREDGHNGYV